MLQELLNLLPAVLMRCPPARSGLCALIGLLLWTCGARFSQSILTLTAVACGTLLGMHLPAWCGWQIDGMGLGVAGAVVLGCSAFLFHGACIGLLLGGGLMLWAGATVWLSMAGNEHWNLQAVHWEGDMIQFLHEAWQGLPPVVSHALPIACFLGLAGGIAVAIFLPRFARALAFSLIGLTLMIVMGVAAMHVTHPKWLSPSAGAHRSTWLALIGLILAGAVVQWVMMRPADEGGSNEVRPS